MANQNTFDFNQYNALMKNANSGLQLYLAIQQLQAVEEVFRRFRSPFAKELIDLVDELNDLRDRNKKYLANREKSSDGRIDNETTKDGEGPITSTDVKDVYNKVGVAKAEGHI